jgi:hypothetical protein
MKSISQSIQYWIIKLKNNQLKRTTRQKKSTSGLIGKSVNPVNWVT